MKLVKRTKLKADIRTKAKRHLSGGRSEKVGAPSLVVLRGRSDAAVSEVVRDTVKELGWTLEQLAKN